MGDFIAGVLLFSAVILLGLIINGGLAALIAWAITALLGGPFWPIWVVAFLILAVIRR
jgi:hypothetical protein